MVLLIDIWYNTLYIFTHKWISCEMHSRKSLIHKGSWNVPDDGAVVLPAPTELLKQ